MKIHFIGIGGIGVSALAAYYLQKGAEVFGSDLESSETIETLKKTGAKIFTGEHKILSLKNPDLVIYSPAVEEDNPELKEAKKLGVKCQSYPEALGELTRQFFTIAVSGAHGKSTTTSMLGLTLIKAGLDPTVIVGTKLKEFGNTNFRMGKSKYLVIEADEWQASFLNYWPKIIVLTNIEPEHLDYYKDLNHILKTFGEYVSHLPKDGVLVANNDDQNISKIKNQISKLQFKVQNYSLKQDEAGTIRKLLKIPGEHNVYNALACLATARELKIPDDIFFEAISEYRGAWRRFEIKETAMGGKKITVISDYGHHPTEILATLKAAREKYPDKKIWCVFQPHQYQRTFYLFDDFVKVFKEAPIDKIIITDIFSVAGRETDEIKGKVNSEKLVDIIAKNSVVYMQKEKIRGYLKDNLENGQVLIIMGAGDVYRLAYNLS